jgi:hypothetical protein
MSGRTPRSLWDRLMSKLDGEGADEEREVDESLIAFHLLFIVPIFLVLVMLMRR